MDKRKAHALVDTIIETHAEALRVRHPDAQAALQNARLDLHGLVSQIIEECTAEALNDQQRRGGDDTDFDRHADDAIEVTHER